MSKLISVYDNKESLNNVMSALTLDVDEVFFVYHHKVDKKDLKNIEKVLKRNKNIKVHFKQLKNDVKEIRQLMDDNPDIIVEVSAVKYLSLLLFEFGIRNKNRIIYYDDEENVIKDYLTHSIITENVYRLNIEDVLNLRGGEIVSTMHQPIKDEETKNIILEMMKRNIEHYPAFIHTIQKVNSIISNSKRINDLSYEISEDNILYIRNNYRHINRIVNLENNILTIKNIEIKRLISTSGSFLENYLFSKLVDSNQFDDVMMSVVVDFSNQKTTQLVRCEIDSMIIYKNRLLFVSCKSNKAGSDALNEIYAHNKMFGNALSEAVLVIVEDLSKQSPSIYAKAEELGIKVIDNTDFVNDDIINKFEQIVKGTYEYEKE